jgi:hypothetical protein
MYPDVQKSVVKQQKSQLSDNFCFNLVFTLFDATDIISFTVFMVGILKLQLSELTNFLNASLLTNVNG